MPGWKMPEKIAKKEAVKNWLKKLKKNRMRPNR
jgi:hypothetical protein